jgi:FkbM family methyltransferase
VSFKVFIKRNRLLSALAWPIVRWTSRWRNGAALRYRQVVVGGTITVAPANIGGRFDVSATSDLASRIVSTGEYERDVSQALSALKPMDGLLVNIGANVGFYSYFLATRFPGAAGVLAIEPNPEAFELLSINIRKNGMEGRIRAAQVCIGEQEGTASLSVVAGKPEYSSLDGIIHPAVDGLRQESLAVPMLPLQRLVGEEKVSLIFVDTEGAETAVFSGARDVLLRDHPILFFEYSNTLLKKFGSSSQELESLLAGLGYEVRDGLTGKSGLSHPYEGEGLAVPVGRAAVC